MRQEMTRMSLYNSIFVYVENETLGSIVGIPGIQFLILHFLESLNPVIENFAEPPLELCCFPGSYERWSVWYHAGRGSEAETEVLDWSFYLQAEEVVELLKILIVVIPRVPQFWRWYGNGNEYRIYIIWKIHSQFSLSKHFFSKPDIGMFFCKDLDW